MADLGSTTVYGEAAVTQALHAMSNLDVDGSASFAAGVSIAGGLNITSGGLDINGSPADWSDLGIATSDVSASDVGLGNVPNTNIAYSSTIPADSFTSTEVSNLRSGKLDDGSTPWTANNYFVASDARTAVEGSSDVADLTSGLTASANYVPVSDGTGGVSWADPESHVHAKYTDADAQGAVTASDVGLGRVGNKTQTVSTNTPSGGQNGDVWFQV